MTQTTQGVSPPSPFDPTVAPESHPRAASGLNRDAPSADNWTGMDEMGPLRKPTQERGRTHGCDDRERTHGVFGSDEPRPGRGTHESFLLDRVRDRGHDASLVGDRGPKLRAHASGHLRRGLWLLHHGAWPLADPADRRVRDGIL